MQNAAMGLRVSEYEPGHETGWCRCRALAFLATAYFDDVKQRRPPCPPPGFGLVASDGGEVVGVLDVSVEENAATIDTIAVHPDAQRRGIGTRLLSEARERALRAGAVRLNAWTRDDTQALAWYRSRGFEESDHYLHVYANHYTDAEEPSRAVAAARDGFTPVIVFSHAKLESEYEARRDFARVHICRLFSRPL